MMPMNMRSLLQPLALTGLSLALAACASSRGLNPQGHVLDVDSLHSERTLSNAAKAFMALLDAQADLAPTEGNRLPSSA